MLHYESLQVYLRLGLKVKKIHPVLEFNQLQWINHPEFTEFNTQKVMQAKKMETNGKALYKIMSNAIYGKTMENLRNRIDVRLVNNEKK